MYDYDRNSKVAYNYDRQKFADAEDLNAFIVPVGRMVFRLGEKLKEVENEPDPRMQDVRAQSLVKNAVGLMQRVGAPQLFWGLIQQYAMSAKDRKLIEKASQEFSKRKPRRPGRGNGLATLRKKIKDYTAFYEAALRVIREGKLHSDNDGATEIKAGSFILINAGGFTDQQMADVRKVVEQAQSKIKSKGFGKVCYGTIQVTNTIGRSTSVLAFYTGHNDELFIRGNLKGKQGPALRTIIHELGHRLHHKFLSSKDMEIRHMYQAIKSGEARLQRELEKNKDEWPKPGETLTQGRKTWVVDRVFLNHRGLNYTVGVHLETDPSRTATILLSNWFKVNGKGEAFVSPYAAKNYEENLAEMFSHYCMGTLPDDQVRMLESVL